MPKYRLKKSRSKSKLSWFIAALTLFLVGSLYLAISSGTGPFSAFLPLTRINAVKCDINPDSEACKFKTGTGGTDLGNKLAHDLNVKVAKQELGIDNADERTTRRTTPAEDIAITQYIKNNKRLINTDAEEAIVDRQEKPADPVVVVTPADLDPAAGNSQLPPPPKPESCAGGNGVKLTPGKYAATGYGWKDGKRSTESGTSQRECVFIDDDCGHSVAVACDLVYKEDPTKVILPVSAGKEYVGEGVTVKANCYDKSGVIIPTGESKCFNGEFVKTETELDVLMKTTCNADTQQYNPVTNKCEAKTVVNDPFVKGPCAKAGTEVQSDGITWLYCGKQGDEVKEIKCATKNGLTVDANGNCRTAETPQCGVGFTYRNGYCDRNAASEALRESILQSGEAQCRVEGKPYDKNTGLCQAQTSGRPLECKAEVSADGTSKTECIKTGTVVTGSKISFCHTLTGFDVNGNCVLATTGFGSTPTNPAAPAEPNTPINFSGIVTRKVSSCSACNLNGEVCKEENGNFTCVNEKLITQPIKWDLNLPKEGEPGSVVRNPALCDVASTPLQGGQYRCLSESEKERVVKTNEAIIGFLIKKPGDPGSIVKDPELCKIGSVKSLSLPGQYQCLSEAGLKQETAVNNFVQGVISAIFKKPGEPGSNVTDPKLCSIGSVPAGPPGHFLCLTEEQKVRNEKVSEAIIGFLIKKPGDPGSIVKDPELCTIGSVKSLSLPGQYQCLSEVGLKQETAVNNFVQGVISAIFKKPGEPGSNVTDPKLCSIGSVPAGPPGHFLCLTEEQKVRNETFNAKVEEFFTTPKIRSVDSCDACVSGEGCILNGLSIYQCVSTGN